MMNDEAAVVSAPASLDSVQVRFDDSRSVADAGLILAGTSAERLGLERLINRWVDLGRRRGAFRPGRKVMTLVNAILAGADSIEDCDLLRSGSTGKVLGHRVIVRPSSSQREPSRAGAVEARRAGQLRRARPAARPLPGSSVSREVGRKPAQIGDAP